MSIQPNKKLGFHPCTVRILIHAGSSVTSVRTKNKEVKRGFCRLTFQPFRSFNLWKRGNPRAPWIKDHSRRRRSASWDLRDWAAACSRFLSPRRAAATAASSGSTATAPGSTPQTTTGTLEISLKYHLETLSFQYSTYRIKGHRLRPPRALPLILIQCIRCSFIQLCR